MSPEEIASPPYCQVQASTSRLDQRTPSPAYSSRVNMTDDPLGVGAEPRDDVLKRSVHYHAEVKTAPVPVGHGTPLSRPASIAGTDDEYGDDDYDWSGEEDLGEEAAKLSHKMGVKKQDNRWTLRRIVTLLFSSLIGSTFLTGVLVAVGVLLHVYWDDSSREQLVKLNVEAWLFWTAANLLISWYLALFVDLVPIVVRYSIMAAWGHVSETIKTRLELYAAVKNTFKPVLYAASCWASWVIIFGHIYNLYNTANSNDSRSTYTKRAFQVIEFLFFFALVVCAQKMLSHAIAFSFHRTAFKDRLSTLSEALPVIEKLRDYQPRISSRSGLRAGRRSATPTFRTPFSEKTQFDWGTPDDGALGDTEDAVRDRNTKRKGKRNSYAWFRPKSRQPSDGMIAAAESGVNSPLSSGSRPITPSAPMLRSQADDSPSRRNSEESSMDAGDTIAQAARVLKSAALHDTRNLAGDDENEKAQEILSWGTGTVDEAKHLARSIYTKLRPPYSGRTFLIPSDFYPIFATHELAESAFRVFDKDNNGDISRGEVKSTLVKVYKERRFLARSMRDVGAALKMLDHILLLFAMVVLFFISLSVFGVNIGDSLTSVYSIGIAASFIFKGSASKAFDAIMFLFVTHPFDTGDRCFIDNENLVVKKMTLFATVFTRVDGTETYYFNSQLFSKFITNVRRSGKMSENCTLQIDWETPLEKLDELERCLNEWLSTEEKRWFEPATAVVLQNVKNQRYLELTIGCGHNGTWQDWGLRCARKTAFHAAVQYYCRQLGIIGYEPHRPIVFADAETMAYVPSSPGLPLEEDGEPEAPVEKMKPSLGFLPPMAERRTNIRPRKSKGRRAILRSMES